MSDTQHLDGALKYLDDAMREMKDRATTYDSPGGEKSMGKAVSALNAVCGDDIKRGGFRESHGWTLMVLVKLVRQYSRSNPHLDSAVDSVAYQALASEARMNEAAPVQEAPLRHESLKESGERIAKHLEALVQEVPLKHTSVISSAFTEAEIAILIEKQRRMPIVCIPGEPLERIEMPFMSDEQSS